jgi:Lon protease-like protein
VTQIAIFPIPDCVTFPGTVFPLHVFEPRYRQMINHCLETGMPVAICHTQKEISPAKSGLPLKEALQTNQATYRPHPVFSAGQCELIKRLDDGRLVVDVHIDQRYRLGQSLQQIPYSVYECQPLADREMTEDELSEAFELVDKVRHRVLAMVQGDSRAANKLSDILKQEEWLTKSPQAFSFELFGLIRFDAHYLQQALEMESAVERLRFTLDLMNR